MAAENPHQAEMDRAAADKALADAQTAAANAQKAQYEAQAAAAKARFGDITGSGLSGAVEAGTNAGGAEALLLGMRSLNKIAEIFANAIDAQLNRAPAPAPTPTPTPTDGADTVSATRAILLFSSASIPDFMVLSVFKLQIEILQKSVETAEKASDENIISNYSTAVKAASLATLGLGLEAVSKLLSFAKTDYKFASVDIEASDAMLLAGVAGHLAKNNKYIVEQPSTYLPSMASDSNPVLKEFIQVDKWSKDAKEKQTQFQRAQVEIEKRLSAKPNDEPLTKDLQNAKAAVAAWTAVNTAIDGWTKTITTADDKSNIPLAQVLRQGAIKQKLAAKGAAMLVLQVHKAAGTTYTKKNLWSSLGKNPFYVTGGAVASYSLYDGMTGKIIDSRLLPLHGGYHSISDIPEIFDKDPSFAPIVSPPTDLHGTREQ